MTVSSQVTKVTQIGNGVTTDIPFPNVVFVSSDLTVLQTSLLTNIDETLIEGVDYTVDIAGDFSSATVVLAVAPSNEFSNTVKYSVPITQETVYAEGGEFPARSHEQALDKLTLINLTQQEQLDRSIKNGSTVVGFDPELPVPKADGILTVNSDASGWLYQLFQDIGISPNPMSWEGPWQVGSYKALACVRDGNWTMVANKDTIDKAAPIPVGGPESNTPLTPVFVDDSNVSVVATGHIYTFSKLGWISQLEVYIPTLADNVSYRFLIVNDLIPSAPVISIIEQPDLEPNAWNTIGLGVTIVTPGMVLRLVIEAITADATTQTVGPWTFQGVSEGAPPSSGWNYNQLNTRVRIDKTDLTATDRTADLLGMIAGTNIRLNDTATPTLFREFHVIAAPTDLGTYIEFEVVLINALGHLTVNVSTDMVADTPVSLATDYVSLPDYWPANTPSYGIIEGFKSYNGILQGAQENILFGVDVTFQEASFSPDWDTVATLSSAGGTGGGGGNPAVESITNQTASTGLVDGGLVFINGNGTTIDIDPADGVEVDNYTNPLAPALDTYHFDGVEALVMTDIAIQDRTYVGIRQDGIIDQQISAFTYAQRRVYWWVALVAHPNNVDIAEVLLLPNSMTGVSASVFDFKDAQGQITLGLQIAANVSANLTINRQNGVKVGTNINWANDRQNPNELFIAALLPITNLIYSYTDGSGGFIFAPPVTDVIPVEWDNNGVLTAVTAGFWTIQRVYANANGTIFITKGQGEYPSLSDAITGLTTEQVDVDPALVDGNLRCFLLVDEGATDLTDLNAALFLNTGRFGNLGAGGTSGGGFGDVQGPGASTDNALVVWDGPSGTFIKNSAINIDLVGDVKGPAVSTADVLAVWNAADGTLLQDSTIPIGDVGDVKGPVAALDDNIVVFDGTSGKGIKDSNINISLMGDVKGPVAATDDAIAVWDGVSGSSIKNSTVNINAIGDVLGPLASTDQGIAIYNGATGKVISDSGILISSIGDVRGPLASTDNFLAVWDGVDGGVLKNSNINVDSLFVGGAPDIILQWIEPQGTNGGDSVAGSFLQVILNTEVRDRNNDVVLAANRFTLTAGTYYIQASTPHFNPDGHTIRLWNFTGTVQVATGLSDRGQTQQQQTTMREVFTIAAGQELELQYQVGSASALGFGQGFALSFAGISEKYATVELWRIS